MLTLSRFPEARLRRSQPADETPADILRELAGHDPVTHLARRAQLDKSTLGNYFVGRHPNYEAAVKIATNLKMEPELRARWFRACGYEDPRSDGLTYEPIFDDVVVSALRGPDALPQSDRDELERLLLEEIARRRARLGIVTEGAEGSGDEQ